MKNTLKEKLEMLNSLLSDINDDLIEISGDDSDRCNEIMGLFKECLNDSPTNLNFNVTYFMKKLE